MADRRRRAGRYDLLDVIRGVTLISMIAYHTAWDLVYIFGFDWPWYRTKQAFYWQQSICWTFILLSGFCIPLARHKWKRGFTVFAAGLLVTMATIVFMPQDRVIFGVLTFIGSAMLITAMLEKVLIKIPVVIGVIMNMYLFYVFYHVSSGFITLFPDIAFSLPSGLYKGLPMTYLGFMEPGFFSTDYFALLPWIFLYFAGFFLNRLFRLDGTFKCRIMNINIPPLSFLGRNSLLVYLLHQPAVYMILTIFYMWPID